MNKEAMKFDYLIRTLFAHDDAELHFTSYDHGRIDVVGYEDGQVLITRALDEVDTELSEFNVLKHKVPANKLLHILRRYDFKVENINTAYKYLTNRIAYFMRGRYVHGLDDLFIDHPNLYTNKINLDFSNYAYIAMLKGFSEDIEDHLDMNTLMIAAALDYKMRNGAVVTLESLKEDEIGERNVIEVHKHNSRCECLISGNDMDDILEMFGFLYTKPKHVDGVLMYDVARVIAKYNLYANSEAL
jgi:hypothetical protein